MRRWQRKGGLVPCSLSTKVEVVADLIDVSPRTIGSLRGHSRAASFEYTFAIIMLKITRKRSLSVRARCALSALGLIHCGGAFAVEPGRALCATLDAEAILQSAVASKLAQERLVVEFSDRAAVLESLSSERNRVERLWLDAKKAGLPADQLSELKTQHEKASTAERDAAKPIRLALERRKQEELGALIERTGEIYKRIGLEQDFKLLFQNGEKEPVFVLDTHFSRAGCRDRVDLTAQVMKMLDSLETLKP
jgi:Skp family chaperone for outer membrane proteins